MTRKTTRQILAIGTLAGFVVLTGWLLSIPKESTPEMASEMWTAWLGLTTSINTFYFMTGQDES